MPFTVSDFHDLVELLEQQPSWRAEMRRLLLTDDILRLPKTVENLAATVDQFARSTEERFRQVEKTLADLAAAQQRTEQRLEELAAAQQRTEQRLEELAAAQQRTEQRLEELAAAQQRTSEQVARLQNIIGVTVEEEAAAVLRVVLEEKGYHILTEALYLRLNGDVDVAQQVEDAQGRRLWAVLEAKTRLGWQAVEAWANRMRSEGFRAALRRVGVEGPFLVYVYGMRADLSARKAVEKFGVGLLSSQGEIVPPNEELPA
ncbi:hypothetical protein [Candidatus Roseilinea sp. NK_OTU-006]|jgi:F0F1-type ATP synthase delta subunit|uniref:hypothetical protein n=1 Tax=Candidatus Roseilinea sp. NK_OTU-006 TaxID=2704250 RepID=UPI00145F8D34|nr:hypothetical protein [Candidatus Roseilinea sp. NK_OTU-006]